MKFIKKTVLLSNTLALAAIVFCVLLLRFYTDSGSIVLANLLFQNDTAGAELAIAVRAQAAANKTNTGIINTIKAHSNPSVLTSSPPTNTTHIPSKSASTSLAALIATSPVKSTSASASTATTTTTTTATTAILTQTTTKTTTTRDLSGMCPLIPANLVGRISVDTNTNDTTLESIAQALKSRSLLPLPGGTWSPASCKARFRVAIIVPYRSRETNLLIFLRHMHPFLMKQQLDYAVYIVEPRASLTFNRGMLMNIGFLESLKQDGDKWDCFMFHDVDLLPEDERNIYSCPEIPRHMSAAVSTFNYRLPYDSIFGGVSSLTKEQMRKVNGYSNLYFGWGGEDDDFRERIVRRGYQISRYPLEIGRYLMAKHSRDQTANPERFNLLNQAYQRMEKEGLNTMMYEVDKVERTALYTHLLVNYDQKAVLARKYMK